MEFDHIAVAGETLDAATYILETALGVQLQPGGRHDVFGTHNRLLGLDDGLYIEAIATDPAAPPPGRPRWFGLDAFSGPARLTNWICRVHDLDTALAGFPASAGVAVALARGDLRWRMAVPPDGHLPFDNLFPALIAWQGDLHPAKMLPPSGCRLARLTVAHPRGDELGVLIAGLLEDPRIAIETGPAGLCAEIDTPHGRRVLE